ncbi:phage polarity suppression protein [Enterobacter sp.]|uniref:phage polarity suppression protein n=1 Tax=Enterobacter sp. TaxID=42895 RepID=UPI00296F0864|nr:phage polarity suppression protein [Enterobacter sp.]
MTTITTEQAFAACEANKSAWLERKAELAQAELELRRQILNPEEQIPAHMEWLRGVIDIKKWEINMAAGRYIHSHEEVQRISIQHRLSDFMQAHGAEQAAALAPELKNMDRQQIKNPALVRATAYLRDALYGWLEQGAEINYAAKDNDILTAIGFRPDAASRADCQEKYTPAQNLIYANRRAEMAAENRE